LEAAKRETYEEAGIPTQSDFLQLDTVEPVPVTEFRDSYLWGDNVYVIPQYCFGVLVKDSPIVLSREHIEYAWLTYESAGVCPKKHGAGRLLIGMPVAGGGGAPDRRNGYPPADQKTP